MPRTRNPDNPHVPGSPEYYRHLYEINKDRKREQAKLRERTKRAKAFGLTLEDLARLEAQGCAICGFIPESDAKALHMDHDHETGKFRGMLCSRHNTALGLVHDNTEELELMIEYLWKNRG